MARRDRSNQSNTENTENTATEAPAEVTTQPEEAPAVSTDTDIQPETSTEVPAQAEAPAEATEKPAEIDLSAFTAAVEAAVAQRDEATGELPEVAIQAAQAEYRALEGGLKAKNAAKKLVEEQMREAMNQRDISAARAFMLVSDNLSAGASAKAEKAPADPREAYLVKARTLALALELVRQSAPEGAPVGDEIADADLRTFLDQAAALKAYSEAPEESRGDEPEADTLVKAAVKLAQGKSARVGGGGGTRAAFTGERRDIGKHIAEAFAEVEPGTFLTVAEIRKFTSSEYGSGEASAGAISARLFPTSGNCTVEGVEPGQNEKGNKGATKVA